MKVRANVVDGIKSSLERNNRVRLIEKHIANGCTVREIATAFNGTKWRFYLRNCGLRIVIADIHELYGELQKALESFTSLAQQLVAHDKSSPSMREHILQIRLRTEVARAACHMMRVEARVNLFLFQKDKVKWDVADPVADVIQPLGFELKKGFDFVTEIGAETHQQGDRAQILFAIKKAAEGTDPKVVAGLIQGALLTDVPIAAVARQLKGTQWRYRIVNGPVEVEVESTDSMM
ncbi:hypothetical protein Q9L58_010700, partial [Maublancomyces gigas]